jgi:hypothetical protein
MILLKVVDLTINRFVCRYEHVIYVLITYDAMVKT